MFDKVLIGVDYVHRGRDPIALARQLASESAELTLAHVYPGDARIWPGAPTEYAVERSERALELLRQARDETGIEVRLLHIESASVGRGLHELAESAGADLLVVGSSARGLAGRVLLGDDTHAALNGAPYAVAIAPGGYASTERTLQRIGVAYNESAEAEHALSVARELAATHHATLSAMEVVSLPTYAFLAGPAPCDGVFSDLVDAARERLSTLEDVEVHAAYGNAAEELASYSGSLDLLVVGSRGYGPVGRLVHGSTSQRLARTARCPLLVLTRAVGALSDADGRRQHAATANVA